MDANAPEDEANSSLKHQSRRLNSVPSENGGGGTTIDHNKYSPRSNRSAGGEDNNISQSAATSRTPVKKAATNSTDNNTVDDGGGHHHQRLQDVSPAKKLPEGIKMITTESAESARKQCKYCGVDHLAEFATSVCHPR